MSRYDGQTWTTFTTKDGLADNAVTAIIQDREGNLWLGTWGGGVSRYDGQTWTTFTAKDGLADNAVTAIIQDREGNLWLGIWGGGVSRYDGQTWTTFTTKDGLADNDVMSLLKDREGNLWIGTYGGGVSCYDDRTFTTFTIEDGLVDNFVIPVFQDRAGDLWIGTNVSGISRYDGKTWTTFTTDDGLAGNSVRSIFQDREDNLWFGTDEGVSRYDGRTWVSFAPEDGMSGTSVYSIVQDRTGILWFSTFNGVSRYNGQTWATFTTENGLAHNTVLSMLQDREGHFWFGTTRGVSRYDGRTWTTFTTKDGLVHNTVLSMLQDREGHFWFGTLGGVSRYDGQAWTTFTTEDGLAHDVIGSIVQDSEGVLWFGTQGRGVSRYDGQTFQTLTRQDGLWSNAVFAIVRDRSGVLWFGTTGGMTRYQMPKPAPPPVTIDAVVADRRYAGVTDLSIPSNISLAAFEFAGYSFKTRPGGIVYRYRLVGYDGQWKTTRERRVEYEDLPRGRYTFEVQAVDRDLVYSEKPATVNLEVFYQPIGSVVQISEVDLQDVFPSFYKTYTQQSIGSVMVSNTDSNPIEAKVSFYIPDLMPRPTEQTVMLKAHDRQEVSLNAIFDSDIMNLKGDKPVQAEVALSCEVGNQTISVKESQSITIHGRGALTWDTLGRAAAFVTPEDPAVVEFSRGLWEDYRHQVKGRKVDGNIPTAMLMFEALTGHGIKYAQDSSSPYSQAKADRLAVDHIQYPAELLQSRLGDCDDCTVLYCSLLENLNIPTAFVDAPAHILMLFDSGVTDRREFGFSLDEDRYVLREGRIWIPVEVTKLGEGSFMEAWELGAQTCERLASKGALRITDVREVWTDYPYALPLVEGEYQTPDASTFEKTFLLDIRTLREMREAYVDREYIRPLLQDPDDHFRRMNLAKTRIEAEDYQNAIGWLMPLLDTDDKAEAYYLIGYIFAGQKDFESAVTYFEKALKHEPDHSGYARTLEVINSLLDNKSE